MIIFIKLIMAIEILKFDLKSKYLLKIFQLCLFYVIRGKRKVLRPNKNKGIKMKKATQACPSCGGKLVVRRACPNVIICCDACNKSYPQDKYKELIDDYWEEKLANIPVNRL